MRMTLSLRSLLLAGLAAVALVIITVAWIITTSTGEQLVDQVDDQLLAASSLDPLGRREPPPRGPGQGVGSSADPPPTERPERLSPLFEGLIHPDGTIEVLFTPNLPGQDYGQPQLDPDVLAGAEPGVPFTVDARAPGGAEGGPVVDGRFRVLATPKSTVDGDLIFIQALPLAEVDASIDRLILVEVVGALAILAMLAAVAWWVLQLGIRPIEAMTETATEIAAGDLSIRVPEPNAGGTEAAALASALNVMLGRIEGAVDERARSEQRLRRFVADASHELRTPVTTIGGYAELYRGGGLVDPDALADAMTRTGEEADRMGRLVEDMLTLAKLDQEPSLARVEVDLGRLVTDIAADATVTAPEHRVVVETASGPDADLRIIGDEDRLRQAVANLVGNATLHTPPGTAVTISVQARPGSGHIVLDVIDDGPGIDPEHLDRVTERFYRVDRSRSRHRGGSGLGLAIVKAVVEAHQGSVEVFSRPGSGTRVTIRLPTDRSARQPIDVKE